MSNYMCNSVLSILLNIWIMCNKGLCRPSMGQHSRPICRPSIGRYSVDMLFELIDGRHNLTVCRSALGRHLAADMLRLTVGCVSVDCRWYRSIVRCSFAEIAVISFPTGDAKEDSIAYIRVLIERRCSPNCRHFENICNGT